MVALDVLILFDDIQKAIENPDWGIVSDAGIVANCELFSSMFSADLPIK
jgi:hypothetical protein